MSVTAIIPVFNGAQTLARAVDSVLAQTRPPEDIVVVDDCSTDGTAELIGRRYGDKVTLVRHDVNKGAGAARNTGIRTAVTEYVAFLDADDQWKPGKLERQLQFVAQTGCPICVTGYRYDSAVAKNGRGRGAETTTRLVNEQTLADISASLFWGCTVSPGSTLMARRTCFTDAVGFFDESLRRLEDWDWLLKARAQHAIANLGEVLSVVTQRRRPRKPDVFRSLELIRQREGQYDLARRSQRRRFRSTINLEKSAACYWNNNLLEATWYGILSLLQYPKRNKPFYRRASVHIWDAVTRRR